MYCIVCSPEGDSKPGYCARWKICNYCYTNTLGLMDDHDEDAYKLHHLPYTTAYFHLSDEAARSNVFRNMLDDDGLMEISGNDTIVLPDMSRDELNCFLEFIYKGELSKAKLVEHSKALFTAAHKYDVPSLAESLLKELNIENVLGVLEISHPYSIKRSKEIALKFIVKNKEKIVSTPEYAEFSNKNRDLSLEIQRAISGSRDIRLISRKVKRHGERLYKTATIIF